jgi:hypothetical protein
MLQHNSVGCEGIHRIQCLRRTVLHMLLSLSKQCTSVIRTDRQHSLRPDVCQMAHLQPPIVDLLELVYHHLLAFGRKGLEGSMSGV